MAPSGLRHPDGGDGVPGAEKGDYQLALLRQRYNQQALPAVIWRICARSCWRGGTAVISRPLYR